MVVAMHIFILWITCVFPTYYHFCICLIQCKVTYNFVFRRNLGSKHTLIKYKWALLKSILNRYKKNNYLNISPNMVLNSIIYVQNDVIIEKKQKKFKNKASANMLNITH